MGPIEATNHKCYLEEVEVSFPNKMLKTMAVENPIIKLASKCTLDFMGVSKLDVLQGARQTKYNQVDVMQPFNHDVHKRSNNMDDGTFFGFGGRYVGT